MSRKVRPIKYGNTDDNALNENSSGRPSSQLHYAHSISSVSDFVYKILVYRCRPLLLLRIHIALFNLPLPIRMSRPCLFDKRSAKKKCIIIWIILSFSRNAVAAMENTTKKKSLLIVVANSEMAIRMIFGLEIFNEILMRRWLKCWRVSSYFATNSQRMSWRHRVTRTQRTSRHQMHTENNLMNIRSFVCANAH